MKNFTLMDGRMKVAAFDAETNNELEINPSDNGILIKSSPAKVRLQFTRDHSVEPDEPMILKCENNRFALQGIYLVCPQAPEMDVVLDFSNAGMEYTIQVHYPQGGDPWPELKAYNVARDFAGLSKVTTSTMTYNDSPQDVILFQISN